MIGRVKLWIGCSVLMLLLGSLSTSSASAQGFGPGGYGLGFFNYGNNYNINQQRIPYYALFPPVYYSYAVPRPYGYSPFAYPPGVMTPEVHPEPTAAEYRNPFVPQRDKPRPDKDQTASAPRMYLNPYVHAHTASK